MQARMGFLQDPMLLMMFRTLGPGRYRAVVHGRVHLCTYEENPSDPEGFNLRIDNGGDATAEDTESDADCRPM